MEGLVNEAAALYAGRRVLVTGAAGFVGRRLVGLLANGGAEIAIMDAPAADLSTVRSLSSQVWAADICDPEAVLRCVQASQPEYVFHLAAVGVSDPFLSLDRALAVNLHGSLALFRACLGGALTTPPIKLVHTGTPYEYGAGRQAEPAPINPYAASKAAAFAMARMLHRTQSWPIVTVRPFQVYGPGQPEQTLIPSAIRAALSGRPFRMTGGEQQRDLIYLDDVARGMLLAAARGHAGRSYDLGWGQSIPLREAIILLFELQKTPVPVEFGALPYRPGEIWDMRADPTPAWTDLSWRASVPLREGLERTIRSLQP